MNKSKTTERSETATLTAAPQTKRYSEAFKKEAVENRWVSSVAPQGGDNAIALLVGFPSIAPLFPLAVIFKAFNWHWPPRWSEGDFYGSHIWRIYFLAAFFNTLLLAAFGATVGFAFNLLGKRQTQKLVK